MSRERKSRHRLDSMTQALYQTVVDETIGSLKSMFIERGISEDVLRELRALWEENVSKSGAIGEYVGHVKTEQGEGVTVASGDAVGTPNPPRPTLPQVAEKPVSDVEDSIKVEEPVEQTVEQTETNTEQTKDSAKRPLESEGAEEKPEKKARQDEDELLGSDLDDSEIGELDDVCGADAAGQVDENNSANTVLGGFLKVTRSKNRWKVALSGCVGCINGRDYIFKKLALELDWS